MRHWLMVSVLVLLLRAAAWAAAAPSAPASARIPVLRLTRSNGEHLSLYYRYCLDSLPAPATPARAEALWRAGAFRAGAPGQTLNQGLRNVRVWLRLDVENTLPDPDRFLWSFYEFLDSAALYQPVTLPGGAVRWARVAAASSWVPAAERPFPARGLSLLFTLRPHERTTLYAWTEQRGGVYLPTDVTTTEDFLAWETTFLTKYHWLWLIGLYVSSALFNVLLFGFLRDRIHLWYAGYVLGATLFLLMVDGIDSLIFPAGAYRFIWQVRQLNWLLLTAAAGLRVMQLFLNTARTRPRLNRGGNALTVGTAALVLTRLALEWTGLGNPETHWWLQPALVPAALLPALFGYGWVLLGAAWLKPRTRRLAYYYGATYLCFFTGALLFWLNHLGLTNFNLVKPNAFAWGLLLEVLILSALLTGRFRWMLRQNARLRIRRLKQQNEQGARLITAQEEERERLAHDLHDALGPNLTALHLLWESTALRRAVAADGADSPAAQADARVAALLRQVRAEVRTLSHRLPRVEKDLATAIGTLVADVNAGSAASAAAAGLRVTTDFDPNLDLPTAPLPPPVRVAAYRIAAELLNNVVRHAQATEALVQVLRYPQAVEILVQDNGRGFSLPVPGAAPAGEGLGLRSIRSRAGYLGGTVHLDSSSVAGTSIFVRLPLPAVDFSG